MKAHAQTWGADKHRDWREPGNAAHQTFRSCAYCGSIHPADLAAELRAHPNAGTLEMADRKYGWPHKFYASGSMTLGWCKFYTEHLQDADDADRELIMARMGLRFTFGTDEDQDGTKPGEVRWSMYAPRGHASFAAHTIKPPESNT